MGIRKIVDKTDSNERNEYPAKPYNKPLPKRQTSSGSELDPCCEPGYAESTEQPKE